MRKHPLIALTAFAALTASAIAGASTGPFESTAVLTGVRTHEQPRTPAARRATPITSGAEFASPVRFAAQLMPVLHDPSRLLGVRLNNLTGLPLFARRHAHRAKPRVVDAAPAAPVESVAAVVTTTTAPVVTTTTPPVVTTTTAPPPPAGGVWYELRVCESGDDYAANTGNGFYGAYQFLLSTWYSLGFTGLPSDASPATQDRAAEELQAEAGWGQWPVCSAELGL